MRNVDKAHRTEAAKPRAPRRRAGDRRVGSEEAGNSADRQAERGFLFEDPYWDDVFCSYYDPTLRTCCGR